jgi:hypothetical protein
LIEGFVRRLSAFVVRGFVRRLSSVSSLYIYIYTSTYVNVFVCMFVCVCICVCVLYNVICIYIYIRSNCRKVSFFLYLCVCVLYNVICIYIYIRSNCRKVSQGEVRRGDSFVGVSRSLVYFFFCLNNFLSNLLDSLLGIRSTFS